MRCFHNPGIFKQFHNPGISGWSATNPGICTWFQNPGISKHFHNQGISV